MLVVLVIIAILVVAIAAFLVWFFKFRDPLRGEDFYKFHVEQKWPWELTLTREQETAFMAGLEAYDDEKGCFPKREEGILRVRRPMMLVSLFGLTEQFAAMGPAAMQDPAGAVRELLNRAANGEADGVLYLDDEWIGDDDEVDGMDKYAFTSAVMSAMHAQGVEHEFAGGYADEDYGYATMGVLAKNPEHVDRMYADADALAGDQGPLRNRLDVAKAVVTPENPEYVDAFQRAEVAKNQHVNTVVFGFDRLLGEYRRARPELPDARPDDVLSVVLARMVEHDMSGCTWARPPSREQQQLAVALLSNRG